MEKNEKNVIVQEFANGRMIHRNRIEQAKPPMRP